MTQPFEFVRPSRAPRAARRLLAVFDGGNAPGYSSIAVALTEEGTRRGYEVWAASEGFRSLTEDAMNEPRFERLVISRKERYDLLSQGIPARSMGRRVQDPGSDFRSERYLGAPLPYYLTTEDLLFPFRFRTRRTPGRVHLKLLPL